MYYIKKALIPLLYTVFLSLIGCGIIVWDGLAPWLGVVFGVLNLALFVFIVFIMTEKDGEDAMKVRNTNDKNRLRIIETGEDFPINRRDEYKAYKGFIIGLVSCAPLIILLIIHGICLLAGGTSNVGLIAVLCYEGFLVFFTLFDVYITGWYCFLLLIIVALVMLMTGFAYIFGGRKMQGVYDDIKSKNKKIHGE